MIKWKYKPTGNCPVQAEGWFLGHHFYFRARGNKATIEFSKTEEAWENNLTHTQYRLYRTKKAHNAGWLPKRMCKILIWQGCLRFLLKGIKINQQSRKVKK